MNSHTWKSVAAMCLLAMSCFSACYRQQAPPPPSVPEVTVVTLKRESVVLTCDLPGRTSGFLCAEIRPQVNGLLEKRLFTEGAQVKDGDQLYQIDPAPYQAALDSAEANLLAAKKASDRAQASMNASTAGLKRHQAILDLSKTNFERYENLLKTQAASGMQRDQAATDVEVAQATLRTAEAQVESDRQAVGAADAAIKQAEAAVMTARINLDYTKIHAPITGRIGRSIVTEGDIVTAYQAAPLAMIQQFDPMYVDVPQSTAEVNRLRRSLASGGLKKNGTDRVKITLEDGTPYPQDGSLEFRDVTVDPTTGSVILRIVVPNPDFILLPGMFVRATIDEGVDEQAILVPQQAVSRDPKGHPTTLIVNASGKVEQRIIATDRALGDKWLVLSGIAEGDRVIVEGLQKVRPGAEVKVVSPQKQSAAAASRVSTIQAGTKLN